MAYIQLVESWAAGVPKADAEGPARTCYGLFGSFEDAIGHVPPITRDPHYSTDVRVLPLTAPIPPTD